MARILLRAPLSELAGGREHAIDGADDVRGALRELEQRCPAVAGWILDEQGQVRRHVNVYVNGQLARDDTAVGDDDRLQVLPAITGG